MTTPPTPSEPTATNVPVPASDDGRLAAAEALVAQYATVLAHYIPDGLAAHLDNYLFLNRNGDGYVYAPPADDPTPVPAATEPTFAERLAAAPETEHAKLIAEEHARLNPEPEPAPEPVAAGNGQPAPATLAYTPPAARPRLPTPGQPTGTRIEPDKMTPSELSALFDQWTASDMRVQG